jgi:predicted RNA-binding Zn-ribbon protein involved in translation (DUF1610 family)
MVSLVLFVGIVLSFWRVATIMRQRSGAAPLAISLTRGSLFIYIYRGDTTEADVTARWVFYWTPPHGHVSAFRSLVTIRIENAPHLALLIVPLWPVVVVSGFIAWRRRPRATRASRCASCGYDLRATPDRCPECGATPVPRDETTLHIGGAWSPPSARQRGPPHI